MAEIKPNKAFRAETLGFTSVTVSRIAELLKSSWSYDVFIFEKRIIIMVQDYEEQKPYLLAMEKTKYDAVCCLIASVNCGGGQHL